VDAGTRSPTPHRAVLRLKFALGGSRNQEPGNHGGCRSDPVVVTRFARLNVPERTFRRMLPHLKVPPSLETSLPSAPLLFGKL
jgi:hypothetical protein